MHDVLSSLFRRFAARWKLLSGLVVWISLHISLGRLLEGGAHFLNPLVVLSSGILPQGQNCPQILLSQDLTGMILRVNKMKR